MVVLDLGFCPRCGGTLTRAEVDGRPQLQCSVCEFTVYRNPLPVVVVAVVDDDRALFVKRARAPEKGCWSLPGGYLELDEPPQAGAARELREETGLEVDPEDLAFVGTIHEPLDEDFVVVDIVFAAPLEKTNGDPVAGDDAAELAFWSRAEIATDPDTLRAGDVLPILWAIDTFGTDGSAGSDTLGSDVGAEIDRYFPEEGFGFDPALLGSATVTRTTRRDPLAPVDRLETRLAGAASVDLLSYTVARSPMRVLREQVVHGEVTVRAVLDRTATEVVDDDPEMARLVREMHGSGRTEFLVHDEVPYLLAVVDGTACIGLLSEEGAPYAMIESDEAAVVEWVASTIDAFGDEATPLDVRSLGDADLG